MKNLEPRLLEALKEYERREIELLEKKAGETDIEFSEQFEEKMEQLFNNHKRKKRFSKFYSTTARKVVSFCIILLAVSFVTIMSVEAFREPIIKYLAQILENNDTNIHVEVDDETEIPTDIESYKKPAYIPKGFEIVSEEKDISGYVITYKKQDTESQIIFDQSVINSGGTGFNTEQGTLSDITVGLYDGKRLSIPQENTEVIFWSDGTYEYKIIGFFIDIGELIKIGESVR